MNVSPSLHFGLVIINLNAHSFANARVVFGIVVIVVPLVVVYPVHILHIGTHPNGGLGRERKKAPRNHHK